MELHSLLSLGLRRIRSVFWDQVKLKQESVGINITRRGREGKNLNQHGISIQFSRARKVWNFICYRKKNLMQIVTWQAERQ